LDEYFSIKLGGSARSGGWKPGTAKNRKQSVDDLVLRFRADRPLDEINAGDGEDWFHWM